MMTSSAENRSEQSMVPKPDSPVARRKHRPKFKLHRRVIGLIAGLTAAILVFLLVPSQLPPPLRFVVDDMGVPMYTPFALKVSAATAVLMIIWWVSEAIPLAATALVPLVVFPLTHLQDFQTTAAPYASGTIFLFMGGFFLAFTVQRWGLHKRVALHTVKAVGTSPRMLILGMMLATGFLSIWVSNTATAVMMLPIGLSILALVNGPDAKPSELVKSNFGKAMMLGIAYSASIASLASLISTPPNTMLRAYVKENYGMTIGFGQWMLFAGPTAVIFLFIGWLMLTRVLFPPEISDIPGGKETIDKELAELGPMSRGEKLAGIVFIAAAFSWLLVPTLFPKSGITDELIAMIVSLAVFAIPVYPKRGVMLLDWNTAKDIPWNILMLFGGGLALSSAFTKNGLSAWIGYLSRGIGTLPVILIVIAIVIVTMAMTEMASNTATAAAMLPVMGGVATGASQDALLFVVPVAMAATCCFMMPMATPPNAIAYGTGYLKMGEMIKAGSTMSLTAIVLITVTVLVMGPLVLGITF
ncbi:DASS family sodium-coupled anion symporter [Actinomycetaceae bacterium MB13-C1-2]|nr:DASS family sodium-coupled anion symporter [Actinomycetaceae bacterium MB13-C1-2]